MQMNANYIIQDGMTKMRDDELEYEEQVEYVFDRDIATVRGSVGIISISFDDVEWFNENCPEWQEHVSFRAFMVEKDITGQMIHHLSQLPPEHAMIILKEMRNQLVEDLAKYIIDNHEPEITSIFRENDAG